MAICCALHDILCMFTHVGLPLKCCKKKKTTTTTKQGKVKARGRMESCWDAARFRENWAYPGGFGGYLILFMMHILTKFMQGMLSNTQILR